MSSASAAVRYIKRGMAPIPIPAKCKGPNLKNWQNLRMTTEDIPKFFNNGQNIGILLGETVRRAYRCGPRHSGSRRGWSVLAPGYSAKRPGK